MQPMVWLVWYHNSGTILLILIRSTYFKTVIVISNGIQINLNPFYSIIQFYEIFMDYPDHISEMPMAQLAQKSILPQFTVL